MLAVRGRRGRRLARFWMTLAFGNTLVSCLLPKDLPCLSIQAVNLPRVPGKIVRWLDVAEKTVTKDCVEVAADSGGDENAIAEHDGTGVCKTRNLGFPDDVSRFADVPGDRRIRTVRHSGRLHASESGPILGGGPSREPHDGKDGEDSQDHFVTTLVNSLLSPPCSSVNPVTVPSSTLNSTSSPSYSTPRKRVLLTAAKVSGPHNCPTNLPSLTSKLISISVPPRPPW